MKIVKRFRLRLVTTAAGIMLALAPLAHAQSAGAKNHEGNRLFSQGKFQEAEKAYLEAQADMPGRPELSYNLGNALVKQNKYDQALGALHQAVTKGDKALQANSWYNVGNALYEMKDYKDSAQAYVQDLRLNPVDADAKHNLELALKEMQKQQQQNQKQDGNQQKADGSGQNEKSRQPGQQQKSGAEAQPKESPGQKSANQQTSQSERSQGTFSKERALQILDALQNQELAEQHRLTDLQARRKASSRDW